MNLIQRYSTFYLAFLIIIINFAHCNAQITFTEHTIDTNEYGASSVCAADINGDGFTDVIVSGHDANRISYYQNNGTAPTEFTKSSVDNTFNGAIFVDAADLNGDGNVDIIGGSWEGNEVAYWLNDGNDPINWTKVSVDANFAGAHEVKAADINGDGFMDILGASSNNHQIAWWENDGNNPVNWSRHIIRGLLFGVRSVACADINGDGHNDVVGAGFTNDEVIILFNNGYSDGWTEQIIDDQFNGSHWLHCVDFDNDGDVDIFGAAAIGNNLAWWRNDGGDPIVWNKQIFKSGFFGALAVVTNDFDNDGDLDAIGTGTVADGVKLWQNNNGNPIQWTEYDIRTNYDEAWGLYSTDLDGDGDFDILTTAATDNEVTWWENETITGVENNSEIPIAFKLKQNYPNPFNPSTIISFNLADEGHTTLRVYDILGNEIQTLVNEIKPAGVYRIEFDGGHLSSGVYFYSLNSDYLLEIRKMILMK